jgi:hypothetical protein
MLLEGIRLHLVKLLLVVQAVDILGMDMMVVMVVEVVKELGLVALVLHPRSKYRVVIRQIFMEAMMGAILSVDKVIFQLEEAEEQVATLRGQELTLMTLEEMEPPVDG